MRCDARTTVRQRRRIDRHRYGRDRHASLADRDGNRLARIPLLSKSLLLPLRGRHEALNLVGQVDAALFTQPEQRRPLVDAVDARHVAYRVEIHIARLLDSMTKVDRAMPAFFPALERAPKESRSSRAG